MVEVGADLVVGSSAYYRARIVVLDRKIPALLQEREICVSLANQRLREGQGVEPTGCRLEGGEIERERDKTGPKMAKKDEAKEELEVKKEEGDHGIKKEEERASGSVG